MSIRFSTQCVTCLTALTLVGACDQRRAHDTRFPLADPRPLAVPGESALPAAEKSLRPSNSSTGQRLERVKVSQFQMGMMVHLTVWAPTRAGGQEACKAAFQRIREINMQMSDYEPTSELSRLCRQAGGDPVPVGRELFEVLESARRLAEWTEGLYDPTAGPLIRLWRNARKEQRLPDATARRAARHLVGYQRLVLDATHQSVQLTQSGMLLDLGSIAKGYAGDQALQVLRQRGITRGVFEAGGDKVMGDPPPAARGWPVEIPHLRGPVRQYANCAVSVSGDTVQYLQIDGKRYSHVVDPRTGFGIESRGLCVVVAANGLTSDPLATLGTLMPGDDFQRLLNRYFPGVEAELFPAPPDSLSEKPRVLPP